MKEQKTPIAAVIEERATKPAQLEIEAAVQVKVLENESVAGTVEVNATAVKFHNHKYIAQYYLTLNTKHGVVELNVGEKTYNTVKGILEKTGALTLITKVNSGI